MPDSPDGRRLPAGLRTTFLVHALVAGLVGVQHLLVPRLWTDLAGITIAETVTWRVIGAALVAFAVSSWLAAGEASWARVRTLVVMEVVWSLVAAATITWGILFEGLAPLEWLNVATLAAFAVAFGRSLVAYEIRGADEGGADRAPR